MLECFHTFIHDKVTDQVKICVGANQSAPK